MCISYQVSESVRLPSRRIRLGRVEPEPAEISNHGYERFFQPTYSFIGLCIYFPSIILNEEAKDNGLCMVWKMEASTLHLTKPEAGGLHVAKDDPTIDGWETTGFA